jgi:hypothetical protein
LRQDGQLARRPATAVLASRPHRRRLHPIRRTPAARRRLQRHAEDPRTRDLHGLPGPTGQPRSVVHHRLPAHRSHASPRETESTRCESAGRRPAQERPHPRSRASAYGISPPALGRDAPAGHDRDGAQLLAAAAHRGRTDHGPRRDDPGPDRRVTPRTAREHGFGRSLRHARPCPDFRAVRRDRGDVRGRSGRAVTHGRALRPSPPPVHGCAVGGIARRSRRQRKCAPRAVGRARASSRPVPCRLSLPPALPVRRRRLPAGDRRTRSGQPGPSMPGVGVDNAARIGVGGS